MKKIIGLAGEIGSGKSTVAGYIVKKYNGSYYRFSEMLRDVLKRIYLPNSRENMNTLSTTLRQSFGEDIFSKVIAEDVKKDDREIIAIDGIRRLDDIQHLKEINGFVFLYIEVDLEKRFERIKKRGENPDDLTKSMEEFKKEDVAEPEMQIKDLKQYADFVIDNDRTMEELYQKIDGIINKN